jgi:hypothetical protein
MRACADSCACHFARWLRPGTSIEPYILQQPEHVGEYDDHAQWYSDAKCVAHAFCDEDAEFYVHADSVRVTNKKLDQKPVADRLIHSDLLYHHDAHAKSFTNGHVVAIAIEQPVIHRVRVFVADYDPVAVAVSDLDAQPNGYNYAHPNADALPHWHRDWHAFSVAAGHALIDAEPYAFSYAKSERHPISLVFSHGIDVSFIDGFGVCFSVAIYHGELHGHSVAGCLPDTDADADAGSDALQDAVHDAFAEPHRDAHRHSLSEPEPGCFVDSGLDRFRDSIRVFQPGADSE